MQSGLIASFGHPDNGMTRPDMEAALRAARQLNEVIVFRSTGRWSMRWLDRGYPSKNFHVKGKSADWGPQAGLVPFDGMYSKVGADADKAAKGTKANKDGEASGFASQAQLRLTRAEIDMQLKDSSAGRTALATVEPLATTEHLLITAKRSGDERLFTFVAVKTGLDYNLFVLPQDAKTPNPFVLADQLKKGSSDAAPLTVMVSEEAGANRKPMTGDYDLMAVCPLHADYMSRSTAAVAKPAIQLNTGQGQAGHIPKGQTFAAGTRLDQVLDMRLHTGAAGKLARGVVFDEHGDMGNLTPRILRCINVLNVQMGAVGSKAALRRVHHNAESHRHGAFGALKAADMENEGDGFPLTGFHPSPLGRYGEVVTIESMAEFRRYADDLHQAGYFVPRHHAWTMSIRDRADRDFGHLLNR